MCVHNYQHLTLFVPAAAVYRLSDLQAELNRWPASYYSKNGKEPLLYLTVLFLSLQFRQALRFLLKDESTKQYRVDAVHLAIALLYTQVHVRTCG